jgi:hypothetical protein
VAGVLAAGSSGCSVGGDPASIDAGALESIVLQQEDVGEPFVSFDAGPLQIVDRPRGGTGWKARYRRAGSAKTRGPLVVESRVDRFDDAGAAEDGLAAAVQELRTRGWSDVDSPRIGDEAHSLQQRGEAVTPVQYFMVVWRHANVVASVTASGFVGKLTLEEVLELARAQQGRTEAAGA